jgi:ATP-binding cassette, subfamily F, member 3
LKTALLKYNGTLIIVSHDRDFLDGLVTKVYEFRNRKIRQHIGGIYDYLRKKDIESKALTGRTGSTRPAAEQAQQKGPSSTGRQKHTERKDYSRKLKKLEKQVAEIEERISDMEGELAEMDKKLQNPVSPPDNDFFSRYSELKNKIAGEMSLWETVHNELETFNDIN